MSIFLINASNLKAGGGIQVTQSIVSQLPRFKEHKFIVALSSAITIESLPKNGYVEVVKHDIKNDLPTLLFGRDNFLDSLVADRHVDAVLTVFGPSRWRPRVPHLCGFARAQLVLTDSPYYQRLSIKERLMYKIWTWGFRHSSDTFYTENEMISNRLPQILGRKLKVYTVSNYYNQVFDDISKWKKTQQLPPYDGITTLSVSSHYLHKNFEILIDAARYLHDMHPDIKFRFVLTFDKNEMPVPKEIQDYFLFIGKIDVSECPYLYEQADIMFMPTLMECFTATYPEAMRMGVPIVTTDLEFAHGLCGDAACYYSAVDAKAAANAIYRVATDKKYAIQLVAAGKEQLKKFDNYEQRAKKLIDILQTMSE